MKKIIRLTESDLIRLVNKIIKEQSNKNILSEKEIKSLDSFLSRINPRGKKGMWKQDNNKLLTTTIQLNPNDKIVNLAGFDIRKPLCWSLYDMNGKKVDGASFNIFKNNNVILYSIFDGKSLYQSNEPLMGNEEEAVETFKAVVDSF